MVERCRRCTGPNRADERDAQAPGTRIPGTRANGRRGLDRRGGRPAGEGVVQARAGRRRDRRAGAVLARRRRGSGRIDVGQVELADTTELRAETGGGHEALLALHRHQLGEAIRAGFAGLALTGDAAAMLTITCDERELAGYERGLERLAVEAGVPSPCRYTADQRRTLLNDMLAVHYRDVADDVWSVEVAVVDGDHRLRVRGEVDFSNAGRFVRVVRAALGAGVRTLDASELVFCDVAGIRALVSAIDALPPESAPLTVTGADGVWRPCCT